MNESTLIELIGWEVGIGVAILGGFVTWIGISLKRSRQVIYESHQEAVTILREILSEMKTHNEYSRETVRKIDEHVGDTKSAQATIIAKLNNKD